ncbi:hypothetical protein C7B18_27365 [Escherichia coli]|nr:hypothetical protein C7B18_27365 [Escherichia coli]
MKFQHRIKKSTNKIRGVRGAALNQSQRLRCVYWLNMLHRCGLIEKCLMWQRKNAAPGRKKNMPVPAHFRFLAHSLTTFGRWGCGER